MGSMLLRWSIAVLACAIVGCDQRRTIDFDDPCDRPMPDGARLFCRGSDAGPGRDRRDPLEGEPVGVAHLELQGLDLGAVRPGERSTTSVRVRGHSSSPSLVRVLSVESEPAGAIGPLGFPVGEPILLGVERALDLDFLFAPTTEGDSVATVTIELCRTGCVETFVLRGVARATALVCPAEAHFGPAATQLCLGINLTCRNASRQTIEVTEIAAEPADGGFAPQVTRMLIAPLSDSEIPVGFCPTSEGDHEGSLRVTARGPRGDVENHRVRLTGTGIRNTAGCAIQAGSGLDLPPTVPGSTTTGQLLISNTGPGLCLVIHQEPPPLSVLTVSSPPTEIAPYTTFALDVTFSPDEPGYYDGEVRWTIMGDGQSFPISMRVTGLSPSPTAAGYELSRLPDVPLPPATGVPLVFDNTDDGVALVDLPFPFALDGIAVRRVTVTTNGWVVFDRTPNAPPRNPDPYPTSGTPNAVIALWWDDLFPGLAGARGGVSTRLSGVAPDRVFAVRYGEIPFFNGVPGQNIDGEIRLHEGGAIEVHYGALSRTIAGGAHVSGSAGWESFTGSTGEPFLPCTPTCGEQDWPTNTLFRLVPR